MKTLNYEKILGSLEFKPFSNIHYSNYKCHANENNKEMVFTPKLEEDSNFSWCSPDKITFQFDVNGLVRTYLPINFLPKSIIDFIFEKYLELKPPSWPTKITISDPIDESLNLSKSKAVL